MRPTLPRWRWALAAVGALVIAIPASAVALVVGQPETQSATLHVSRHHVKLGEKLRVTGNASSARAGQTLLLEFAQTGGRTWQTLGATQVRPDGGFHFIARLRHTGALRVQSASARSADPTTSGPRGLAPATRLVTGDSSLASAVKRVTVAAWLHSKPRSFHVLAGQQITVLGGLLPGRAGREVLLQGRTNGGWRTLGSGRTGGRGGFHVNYAPRALGPMQLRLEFPGDRLNTQATTGAGELTIFRQAVASWYDDAGQTACGFHAHFGVANVSLPCGTSVTFRYGGNTVTAVVDDRGPYVGGRRWDLNQNTAGALGFSGVDTVWSSL